MSADQPATCHHRYAPCHSSRLLRYHVVAATPVTGAALGRNARVTGRKLSRGAGGCNIPPPAPLRPLRRARGDAASPREPPNGPNGSAGRRSGRGCALRRCGRRQRRHVHIDRRRLSPLRFFFPTPEARSPRPQQPLLARWSPEKIHGLRTGDRLTSLSFPRPEARGPRPRQRPLACWLPSCSAWLFFRS